MEILDKVYNTFSNLDRDYARSKKTREEFIKDKFGGDINIGSMIILDAVSNDISGDSPEDIEKLTYIKDTFEALKRMQGSLDKVVNFASLRADSPLNDLIKRLTTASTLGMHQKEVSQKDLNKVFSGVVHYACTPFGSRYADLNKCSVLHIYNEHIQGLVANTIRLDEPTQLGEYLRLKSRNHAVPVKASRMSTYLK